MKVIHDHIRRAEVERMARGFGGHVVFLLNENEIYQVAIDYRTAEGLLQGLPARWELDEYRLELSVKD